MQGTKLIMTILVRDEQDIPPQMLEFDKAQSIDHFIITDNLSNDNIAHILEHYRSRGWVTCEEDDLTRRSVVGL